MGPLDQLSPFTVLTVSEVARLLRVSRETVRRYHRLGVLKALPFGRLMFTVLAIREFLTNGAK